MLSQRLTLGGLMLPLLAAALCGPVRAAELGEVKVNSFIGQQLSADIELVDLTSADLAEIQAKLANPDVFKGAGLSMPSALGGLYISVAKRDNRRFLHLTTLQPVNSEALHLFLELSSGGRQIIRAATLWLTPEPPAARVARAAAMPAAAPMPALSATPVAASQAAAPMPASPPAAAPTASQAVRPAASDGGEAALSAAAQRAFAARKQAAAPATGAAAAASGTAAAAPASIPTPARASTKSVARNAAASQAGAPTAAPTQACPPAPVDAQIQQCQVMTGKLVDLEGKVQRLQQALAVPPPAAAAGKGGSAAHGPESAPASAPALASTPGPASVPASAKAAAEPAKHEPEPAPIKPGAKSAKPGVSAELEAKSRTRWIMIGAGAIAGLAGLGGLVYFLRKRKDRGPLKIWQSFRRKREQEVVEPTMEEVAAQE